MPKKARFWADSGPFISFPNLDKKEGDLPPHLRYYFLPTSNKKGKRHV